MAHAVQTVDDPDPLRYGGAARRSEASRWGHGAGDRRHGPGRVVVVQDGWGACDASSKVYFNTDLGCPSASYDDG